jgi:acyl dehydratase
MTTIRELDSAPSVLAGYAKAFGSALPLVSSLPLPLGLPGGGGDLPDLELRVPALKTDLEHLSAYARVCGFTLRDTLPVTYLNVRAFPVHIALMTDAGFPFGPVGLVHLTNEIDHHRPVGAGEELALRVWATGLDPHPKGRTLTLHTSVADAGGAVVWEARSTMLRLGSGSGERAPRAADPDVPASATWKVPGDIGRRYAAVSGDRNPIHLYGLTAKPFGFSRAIAHGLWTKARAVAALDGLLPDAFTVAVEFRKPVLLPTTVTFGSATDAKSGVTSFAVQDARKGAAHLVGSVTPAKKKRTTRRTPKQQTTTSGGTHA